MFVKFEAFGPVNQLMHDSTDKEASTCPQPAPEHAVGGGLMTLCLD